MESGTQVRLPESIGTELAISQALDLPGSEPHVGFGTQVSILENLPYLYTRLKFLFFQNSGSSSTRFVFLNSPSSNNKGMKQQHNPSMTTTYICPPLSSTMNLGKMQPDDQSNLLIQTMQIIDHLEPLSSTTILGHQSSQQTLNQQQILGQSVLNGMTMQPQQQQQPGGGNLLVLHEKHVMAPVQTVNSQIQGGQQRLMSGGHSPNSNIMLVQRVENGTINENNVSSMVDTGKINIFRI